MASDPGRVQGWPARRLVKFIFSPHELCSLYLHCSSLALALPLAEQEAEENFDLALLATLEIDVIPSLGADSRVPDHLTVGLAKSLERASLITNDNRHVSQDFQYQEQGSSHPVEGNGHVNGTTHQSSLVPRERYSYWCLDLLFLICSDVAKGTIGSGDVSSR